MFLALTLLVMMAGGCSKNPPPVARPTPPPLPPASGPATVPPAPAPAVEPPPVPLEPIDEDPIGSRSLDDLNRDSPLRPVFFRYDSSEVDGPAQEALRENAELLRTYAPWIVTIEGHSDERGTPEYNLALGERRALSARNYLVSLGIAADRLRTISYGKEFPFDPGHDESAWGQNRRAHFVIASK